LCIIARERKRERERERDAYEPDTPHILVCCRSVEKLVTCFTDVTNASCGDKAAKWMFAYKSRLINPVKWKIVAQLSGKK